MEVKTPKLSKEQQALLAAEILLCRKDPLHFIENYIWTLDEDADPGDPTDLAIKKFPDRQTRPELYELMRLWMATQVLGIDKSRQMMGTHTLLSLYLWMAMHPGKRIFLQSKKEDDAKNLLNRIVLSFDKLPPWLKPEYKRTELILEFPQLNSNLWAIPQGGDHIRSYTASGVFSDEFAKQPEAEEAYGATLASIGSYGKFSMLSTPRGKNFFYRIMRQSGGVPITVDGVTHLKPKKTSRNMHIVSVHYSLHPLRDAKWVAQNKPRYDPDVWNQEQEISYEVAVGQPVLRVDPLIHIRPIQYIPGRTMLRGWDFGYRRPACIVTQMNLRDQWMWLWGIVGENEETKDFAARVFEICDAKFPQPRDKEGKPLDQPWLDYCDPHGDAPTSENSTSSIQNLEAAYKKRYQKIMALTWQRVTFEKGIALVRERLNLRNDGEPGMIISDEFTDAKDAVLNGYHFPDDRKSGEHPEYPQKDGYYIHLMDAMRYIAVCIFESYEPAVKDDRQWPQPWLNDVSDKIPQHAGQW